jgi:hypothetical protein
MVIEQAEGNVTRVRRSIESLSPCNSSDLESRLMQPEKKVVWDDSVELFSTMKGFLYSEIAADALHWKVQDFCVQTMSLKHMKQAKTLAMSASDRNEKKATDGDDLAFLLAL